MTAPQMPMFNGQDKNKIVAAVLAFSLAPLVFTTSTWVTPSAAPTS